MSKYKKGLKYKKEDFDRLVKILDFLFPKHEKYNGKIPITILNNQKMEFYCFFETGRAYKLNEFSLYKYNSYYMTSNTSKNTKWKSENLFSLNNIVIDIDCHNENCDIQELINNFLFYAKKDLIKTKELPIWNVEHKTGRGLQLWWHFEQASSKLEFMYSLIVRAFTAIIKKFIEEYPKELENMKIDTAASGRLLGLFRVPFTYNIHTKYITQAEIISKKVYTIQELFDISKKVLSLEEKSKESISKKKLLKNDNYSALHKKRITALEKIAKDKTDTEGYRNNLVFLYYNAAMQIYDKKEAVNETKNFNNSFKIPLKNIDYIINYLDNKGPFKFTVEKFNRVWLQLSKEEEKHYKLEACLINNPEENKIKKQERNNRIKNLAEQGKTYKEIAREIGCCDKTVVNVLKKINFNAKQHRFNKVQELKKMGYTQKEIQHKLNISESTVKRYWK